MRNRKTFGFAIKSVAEDGGSFEGYASIFGNVDRVGDIVVPGAFAKRLDEFMGSGIILFNHDANLVVGSPMDAAEDAHGLWFKSTIAKTAFAQDVRTLMQSGVIKKVSFGYDVHDAEKLTTSNLGRFCDSSSLQPNEVQEALNWGFALKDLEVYDISPVSIAANNATSIDSVKEFGSGGRTLDDHSVAVLAAVKDWTDRLGDIRSLRLGKGGDISDEIRARVDALVRGLGEASDGLKGLMVSPEQVADQQEAINAHARFLELTVGTT